MMSLKTSVKARPWEGLLAFGMLAVLAWLILRSRGLYPAVFADELIYSTFARLLPLDQATIPSYLYFGLYRATNACGPGFLDCARIMNALLFVGAAPFIYLATRTLAGPAVSATVALMSLVLPVASYTGFFMPEGLYFLAFFVLTWLALRRAPLHWAVHALLSGLLLGSMTLVKVHALFLLLPLCLFCAYRCMVHAEGGPWSARALGAALIVAAAALAVKFGLGYLLGGAKALHLFGSFYGGHADQSTSRSLASYLVPAWINGRGHLMALALLFALPLAILLHGLAARVRAPSAQVRSPAAALQLYTLLMLGAAFLMTVMYTASIVDLAPREIERLHMRYYDFLFPLLLMVAASALPESARARLTWGPALLALVLAAGVGLGFKLLPGYALALIDGPDIASLFVQGRSPWRLALLQIALLGLWLAGWRRIAAALFLFVFMPSLLLTQERGMKLLRTEVSAPHAYDSAGLFVRGRLPKEARKDVVIAGSSLALLMRAKFHIDEPKVSFIELAQGAPVPPELLKGRRKWLLVMAPHALPPDVVPAARTAQFTLLDIPDVHRTVGAFDFTKPPGAGLVRAVDGLAGIEHWGRWSVKKQVKIDFNAPLPKKLSVLIKGQSYGPNAQQDYVLRVGGQERRFRIGAAPSEIFVQADTDGLQDSLTIDIPEPTAPPEAGAARDTRMLGLGLIAIEVGERP